MVKVFGHISPDTDATGSALLWTWYLNNHTSHQAEAFVLGTLNKETQFVLERFDFKEPAILEKLAAGDEVVVVDTNNPQELPQEINEASIIQIIDHHKLVGGLTTAGPIDITIKPFASTASVIFSLFNLSIEAIPNNIAGLLLSCILSDTLAFRSPTTTPHDKDIAEKLAHKLGIDISAYSNEMFNAKSDVSDFTDTGLLHIDSKKYQVGTKNIRVSVVETTNPGQILARKAGLVEAIKALVNEEHDVDDVLLFVIDIFKEEATVLTYNELTKEMIEESFEVTVEDDTKVLPGVVSRKKQILPILKWSK